MGMSARRLFTDFLSVRRPSINGNHALRDGPKRRDLLRVNGNYLLETTEPLALRSRLLLAASRRAPAGENDRLPGRGAA
jgi:hypothetical protein